ncbi:MAG: discoidin domain-containing protein, partial [Chloroflexi bacterium]|nr:discoidin domain-containing protein [Chloroflexota bacterium]
MTPSEKNRGNAVEAGHLQRASIDDYATVEATCAGVPVYAFGYTYVYGQSPDLDPGVVLQRGNDRPWTKIKPKKSWEISNSKLGSTPAREPKTAANDDQPLLCVHLIDGDAGTVWCSRGQVQPTVEPVWIRIDLPVESRISAVTLVPHETGLGPSEDNTLAGMDGVRAGQAFPKSLTIRVSRDAWHWETVYENRNLASPLEMTPQVFRFEPRLVKQVWIVAEDVPRVLNLGHCMSIAQVEVRDESGADLALISRGAAVTVSSTHTGYGMDRFTQDMLWPIQYDLGYKWARVGYDMGVFLWSYVEREKGRLEVDPRADEAVSEAVQNGLNIIMCLDKGNWLYAPQPKKKDRTRDLMETYYDRPPEPIVDPAYLQGYLNYVRYMVRHFKDRIRYFEIMNEWCLSVEQYCELAKATIPVIREEYPEARVLAMSPGGFDRDFIISYLKQGLGPLIDVIPWHPFYQADPLDPAFDRYASDVREFKKVCESYGFRGEYMATEWTWSAPYPPTIEVWTDGNPRVVISEMMKAKYAAQLTIKHVGLDMVSLWNETFQTQIPQWSIGLLRNTFTADPLPPTQPEPVYYVQRTLSTALEDVSPIDLTVELGALAARCEVWAFVRGNGERLVAIWLKGRA